MGVIKCRDMGRGFPFTTMMPDPRLKSDTLDYLTEKLIFYY